MVNETLLFKLWYIDQIYTIQNILKKNIAPSSTLHLDERTRYFRDRDTIKFSNGFKGY